jgi:hypothetical protein
MVILMSLLPYGRWGSAFPLPQNKLDGWCDNQEALIPKESPEEHTRLRIALSAMLKQHEEAISSSCGDVGSFAGSVFALSGDLAGNTRALEHLGELNTQLKTALRRIMPSALAALFTEEAVCNTAGRAHRARGHCRGSDHRICSRAHV